MRTKILLIILFGFLNSCIYDQEYSGMYSVRDCKLKSSDECAFSKSSYLELKWSHAFFLNLNDTFKMNGSWSVHDNEDGQILELNDNQCFVGIEENKNVITLFNPHILTGNEDLTKLSFIATQPVKADILFKEFIITIGVLMILVLGILFVRAYRK